MWKIIVAFLVFAALTLFLIMKGGDTLDMSGEKARQRNGARARGAGVGPGRAGIGGIPGCAGQCRQVI